MRIRASSEGILRCTDAGLLASRRSTPPCTCKPIEDHQTAPHIRTGASGRLSGTRLQEIWHLSEENDAVMRQMTVTRLDYLEACRDRE